MKYIAEQDLFVGLKQISKEIPEDAIKNGFGMVNDIAKKWHEDRPEGWV